MLTGLKPWRFIAAFLLGFTLGAGAGTWFYSAILDKPETLMEIGKQKIKGRENQGTWSNEQEQAPAEEEEEKDGWWIFGKRKDKEEKQ
jgi:hypothetical protein